jgi:hypothetical protein
VASFGSAPEAQVVLDFGDGTREILTTPEGTIAHTYVCPQAACEYRARLTIINNQGIESHPSTISEVLLKVL